MARSVCTMSHPKFTSHCVSVCVSRNFIWRTNSMPPNRVGLTFTRLSPFPKKRFYEHVLSTGVADWCSKLKTAIKDQYRGTRGQRSGPPAPFSLLCTSPRLVFCLSWSRMMSQEEEEEEDVLFTVYWKTEIRRQDQLPLGPQNPRDMCP